MYPGTTSWILNNCALLSPTSGTHSVVSSATGKLETTLHAVQQRLRLHHDAQAHHAQVLRLQATCDVFSACLTLAPRCGVAAAEQARLACAGMRCLVTSGRLALEAAQPPAGSTAALPGWRLVLLSTELHLAVICLATPGVTPAMAAEAAPPAQLAAWLAASVQAMRSRGDREDGKQPRVGCAPSCRCAGLLAFQLHTALHTLGNVSHPVCCPHLPAAAQVQRALLPLFGNVLEVLCAQGAWSAHAATAAGEHPAAASTVDQALSLVIMLAAGLALPADRCPAGCSWGSAAGIAHVLSGSHYSRMPLLVCLHHATSSRVVAAVAAAAQLLQLLPLDQPPPGYQQQQHFQLAAWLAALLGRFCIRVSEGPAGVQRFSWEERCRLAAQLLPAASRLPQLMRLSTCGKQVDQLEDGRLQLLLAALPSACLSLSFLCQLWHAGNSVAAGSSSSTAGSAPVRQLAHAATWCNTAASVLSCLHWLQQVRDTVRQRGWSATQQEASAEFASQAVGLASAAAPIMVAAVSQLPTPAAEAADALRATWQLHTAACRLVHYSAATGSPIAQLDGTVVCLLSECMVAASLLQARTQQGQPRSTAGAPAVASR